MLQFHDRRRGMVAMALVLAFAGSPAAPGQCVSGTNAALHFDGGDWVRVPNTGPNVLAGFNDFTIEAWFRTSANQTYQTILANWGGGSGATSYYFRLNPYGNLTAYFSFAGYAFVGGSGLNDGNWHHLAATRLSGVFTMLIDGTSIGSWAFATQLEPSVADFSIGVSGSTNTPYFQTAFIGDIDEVRVWNVGRTPAQINATRTAVLAGNEQGLMGYWRFNEAAGQVVGNAAAATGASLNGTRGADSLAMSDDPTWITSSTAPITQCNPGYGQANSVAASLRVNGVGDLGAHGPFQVAIPTSGPAADQITFDWAGPANADLLLLAGNPFTNAQILPCIGSLDLYPTGITIVGDYLTTPAPFNYLFVLNANGAAQTTFTVPAAILGSPWLSIQGAVRAPSCAIAPWKLTAAFTLR